MVKKRPNGAGTISQRKDGRFMARAYVLTDVGYPKRITIYGSTYDEVETGLNKLKDNHHQGIARITSNSTVGDLVSYWLVEVVAKEKSEGTYDNYLSICTNYIVPALGTKPYRKLTAKNVRDLVYGPLAGKAKRLKGGEVGPRTRQLILSVISSMLSYAVREDWLTRNVAQLVEPPSGEAEEVKPLDDDELASFLPVAAAHRLWALWVIYLSLGLRRNEALGLTWDDIDLKHKIVHVNYQLKRVRGKGLQRVRLKTKKSRRVLPLPEVVERALLGWKLVQDSEQRAAGEGWDGNKLALVFTTRNGKPIEASTINRTLLVLARRCDLRPLHPHALRHSCATFLKALGVEMIVIRDILGHSQISVTADIYTHVLAPELREAIKRMDVVMGGIATSPLSKIVEPDGDNDGS
jgi:integrase